MGRLKKKGKTGSKVAFITRGQAIRRLQLSLKDFRRLCILKGIYPVEPKHKKKVDRTGSSSNKTYYLLKDIQYLSHEPIIWKFWDFKIFMRRVVRAKGRKDTESMKRIRENKPFYKLDHIVRERYPSFVDALRDIDDALSLCFLYAMFGKSRGLPLELIELSRRLTLEFMHYVIETKSLRKVFISIKGYYYRADISGEAVTWVIPHHFVYDRITDVDFQVMRTFTEFYVTLLGFINYRLYSTNSLVYPPKIVDKSIMESEDLDDNHLISALNTPLTSFGNSDQLSKIDDFDDTEDNPSSDLTFHQLIKLQNLFKGVKFFLNREVPRESLVFVIRSFGGIVSWDKTLYLGATYDESDESITHQIVDREDIKSKYMNRFYIQPQWVYDCVNARILLPVQQYFIGATLPPHLSPFVEESEGDYVPPEKIAIKNMQSLDTNQEEDESNEESDTQVVQNKRDDNRHNKNKDKLDIKEQSMAVRPGSVMIEDRDRTARQQKDEEKRLAVMMIPKKKKRLYSKIMFGKKRKAKEAEKLRSKRREFDNKNKN